MADTRNTEIGKKVVADSAPNHSVEALMNMDGVYSNPLDTITDQGPLLPTAAMPMGPDPKPFNIKGK